MTMGDGREDGTRRMDAQLAQYMGDGKLDDDELDALVGELAAYDSLPDDERDGRRKLFLSRFYQTSVEIEATSGPLPPSAMFRRYEEVLPGSADRILAMAESQMAHRQRLECESMRANVAGERRGTWFGGVVSILTVVGSFYLISIGKSVEGMGAILLALGTLTGVFAKQNMSAKKELDEKSAQADNNDIGASEYD